MVTFPNVTPDEISGNAALFQYLSRKIVDYITFLEMLAFNSSLFILFRYRELRPKKKKKLLFLEMRATKKIFTRAAANLFILINLIELFK